VEISLFVEAFDHADLQVISGRVRTTALEKQRECLKTSVLVPLIRLLAMTHFNPSHTPIDQFAKGRLRVMAVN
jgi:hypothetical protein